MAKNQNTAASGESIRFDAFVVEEYQSGGEKQSNWMRVGAAFPHKDGKGFNVQLAAAPLNGKLVLRQYEPKSDDRG